MPHAYVNMKVFLLSAEVGIGICNMAWVLSRSKRVFKRSIILRLGCQTTALPFDKRGRQGQRAVASHNHKMINAWGRPRLESIAIPASFIILVCDPARTVEGSESSGELHSQVDFTARKKTFTCDRPGASWQKCQRG